MRITIAALMLTLAACATPSGEQRYAGLYSEGLETMTFRAEGRDEHWVVAGNYYALQAAAPPRANPQDGFSVCATIEGRLSERGRYGHLGMFPREIEITRVIEAGPCA